MRRPKVDLAECFRALAVRTEQDVREKLHALAQRHRDEPELARLMADAQQAWLSWREASCRVSTFDSRTGTAFAVYWDTCLIRMNRMRADELQYMIDHP